MTSETRFIQGDRYYYDFTACTTAAGWAQLDSHQDAWYFGTWCHPETLSIVQYAEGDETTKVCETVAEFLAELVFIEQWNAAQFDHRYRNGLAIAIDPGLDPERRAAFERIGAGAMLHAAGRAFLTESS